MNPHYWYLPCAFLEKLLKSFSVIIVNRGNMSISHSAKYLGKLGKWSFATVRLIRLHNRKMLTLLFSLLIVKEVNVCCKLLLIAIKVN